MHGWSRPAARRASSRNSRTNLSLSARLGRIRLRTTSFSKFSGPTERARNSSAIPPTASLWRISYEPKRDAVVRSAVSTALEYIERNERRDVGQRPTSQPELLGDDH